MAKLARVKHNIFASQAPVAAEGIEQFGSFAAGTPVYTNDPALVQALGAWLLGIQAAIVGKKNPTLEDINAAFFEPSFQLAYLFENGIAEWNTDTTYFTGSLVNSAGKIYKSVQDNNTGHALTDTAYWVLLVGGSSMFWGGTDTGAANAYALSISGFPANAGIQSGTVVIFKVGASHTNTGASTLAVNSQAPIAILDAQGAALPAGFALAGKTISVVFNGTDFLLLPAGIFNPSGTGHSVGLVPDPGASAGTAKFLAEDGTWKVPVINHFLFDHSSSASYNNATKVDLVSFSFTTTIPNATLQGVYKLSAKGNSDDLSTQCFVDLDGDEGALLGPFSEVVFIEKSSVILFPQIIITVPFKYTGIAPGSHTFKIKCNSPSSRPNIAERGCIAFTETLP